MRDLWLGPHQMRTSIQTSHGKQKKNPKCMVIITIKIKIYKKNGKHSLYKILADKHAFENNLIFLIDVHTFFLQFLVIYIYLPNYNMSIFILIKTISVYFLTRRKVTISAVSATSANTLPLRHRNRSCDKNTMHRNESIRIWFVCLLQHIPKSRTGRQSNRVTSHFVLFETKSNNLYMLCMTIFLCFV